MYKILFLYFYVMLSKDIGHSKIISMEIHLHQESNILNNVSLKFSIIVPVYNVGIYLREALSSIVGQTYNNFEVICVNDGSTDNSLEILNEYSHNDKRFIILSQENKGQGIARNKAIDISSGDYIFFLDPDDYIEPDTLQILADFVNKNKDVDIIQFDYITSNYNPQKNKIKTFKKQAKKYLKFNVENNRIYNWKSYKKLDLCNIGLAVWNKVYSANFVKDNNIKFAPNKHGEDHIFSIKSTLLAKKILYINNVLYHYRIRLNSSAIKVTNNNFCVFENIQNIKEFLLKQNLLDKLNDEFRSYIVRVLSRHYTCISEDRHKEYLNKVSQILSPKEYKMFLKKNEGNFSVVENIFSIKNQKRNGSNVKVLRILGKTFEISNKC